MSAPNCTTHHKACDCREAMFAEMVGELKAAHGYMLNARIDLESGARKATAIRTLDGGINRVRSALARATDQGEMK